MNANSRHRSRADTPLFLTSLLISPPSCRTAIQPRYTSTSHVPHNRTVCCVHDRCTSPSVAIHPQSPPRQRVRSYFVWLRSLQSAECALSSKSLLISIMQHNDFVVHNELPVTLTFVQTKCIRFSRRCYLLASFSSTRAVLTHCQTFVKLGLKQKTGDNLLQLQSSHTDKHIQTMVLQLSNQWIDND